MYVEKILYIKKLGYRQINWISNVRIFIHFLSSFVRILASNKGAGSLSYKRYRVI